MPSKQVEDVYDANKSRSRRITPGNPNGVFQNPSSYSTAVFNFDAFIQSHVGKPVTIFANGVRFDDYLVKSYDPRNNAILVVTDHIDAKTGQTQEAVFFTGPGFSITPLGDK